MFVDARSPLMERKLAQGPGYRNQNPVHKGRQAELPEGRAWVQGVGEDGEAVVFVSSCFPLSSRASCLITYKTFKNSQVATEPLRSTAPTQVSQPGYSENWALKLRLGQVGLGPGPGPKPRGVLGWGGSEFPKAWRGPVLPTSPHGPRPARVLQGQLGDSLKN